MSQTRSDCLAARRLPGTPCPSRLTLTSSSPCGGDFVYGGKDPSLLPSPPTPDTSRFLERSLQPSPNQDPTDLRPVVYLKAGLQCYSQRLRGSAFLRLSTMLSVY